MTFLPAAWKCLLLPGLLQMSGILAQIDDTPSPVPQPIATPFPSIEPTVVNLSDSFNETESPAPTESPITLAPTSAPITLTSPLTETPEEDSAMPSFSPTFLPTLSPSSSPTLSPTFFPTFLSTSSPTFLPTDMTTSPTAFETATVLPETTEPSSAPSMVATTSPPDSESPTSDPDTPSLTPTVLPETFFPTAFPTENATANLTSSPAPSTSQPSDQPSVAPSVGTGAPSMIPTDGPSDSPSDSPTDGLQEAMVDELYMNLFGISSFPEEDFEVWEDRTVEYQRRYYENTINSPIADFDANVTITSLVLPSSTRNLRNLQGGSEDSVGVLYSQTMRYRIVGQNVGPTQVATVPFGGPTGRDAYVDLLNGSGQGVLSDITSSSEVATDATPQPTPAPAAAEPATDSPTAVPTVGIALEEDDEGLGMGAIIGIAVGGGVALIALLLFFLFRSGDNDYEGADDPPPSVSVKRGGDEVSTLAAPPLGKAPASHGSLAGYGDQSVATVDYDYSKAYGGGGDTSVSSAGGTFGSQTQGQSVLDPATAGATGAALGGAGSFSDTDSFEAAYRDPNANVKEEVLNVFAPPGKLGVVIDTPDDGAPVVHAVKDSSVIAEKIQVGDKLVAVDDEDVRSMTAIKVSKLISRKSANPSRKLTIIRSTVME